MNLDLRGAFPGLMAALFLLVIGLQTADALKRSGAWTPRAQAIVAVDPYASLDRQLEQSGQTLPRGEVRDPFRFVGTPVVVTRSGAVKPPPRKPKPVLTAIVADEDPRGLINFEGRNYSVKTGDLFAEFRVMSVTRDEVILLDGGGQSLVLRRPGKGE
jgi:hypothetical protein